MRIHAACVIALAAAVALTDCRRPYAPQPPMSSTSTARRQETVDTAPKGQSTTLPMDPLCHGRPHCSVADRRPVGSPDVSEIVVVRLAAPQDAASDEGHCDRREYWLSRPAGDLLLAVDCEAQWGADNAGPASLTVLGTLATFHYVEFLSNDACEIVDAALRLPQGRIEAHARHFGTVVGDTCRPSRRGDPIPVLGLGTLDHPILVLHRP